MRWFQYKSRKNNTRKSCWWYIWKYNHSCSSTSQLGLISQKKTMQDYCEVFALQDNDLERTGLVQCQINSGNYPPIKHAPRILYPDKWEEIESRIELMKGPGIIELSSSPWSLPVMLIPKKDGTTKFCVDYQKLSEVTRKDGYLLLMCSIKPSGTIRCI